MGDINGSNIILILKKGLEECFSAEIIHYTGDGCFDYNPDDYIEFSITTWSSKYFGLLFDYCNINDWKQWVKEWKVSTNGNDQDTVVVTIWLNHRV